MSIYKTKITEAAATVSDLPENWFINISFPSSVQGASGIKVELVEKDAQGRLQRIQGRRDPWSIVTAYKAEPGTAACLGSYIIEGASAPAGYGPLLYDIAMELAGESGLTPDRSLVSAQARNIWAYYLTRPEISTEQLDNLSDSPDESGEKDCEQGAAKDASQGSWKESPLSKVYYKNNTETLDMLEAAGKIIREGESPKVATFKEPEPDVSDDAMADILAAYDEDELYENLRKTATIYDKWFKEFN